MAALKLRSSDKEREVLWQKKKKEAGIDEKLKSLEDIISRMEEEDISLEEALASFEEGVRLVKETREMLTGIEEKLKVLSEEEAEDDV